MIALREREREAYLFHLSQPLFLLGLSLVLLRGPGADVGEAVLDVELVLPTALVEIDALEMGNSAPFHKNYSYEEFSSGFTDLLSAIQHRQTSQNFRGLDFQYSDLGEKEG